VSENIQPIRSDIVPELDVEREMIDFCMAKVREFAKERGEPRSIALVLIGENADHVASWTPKLKTDRREVRAYAGARLLRDATD